MVVKTLFKNPYQHCISTFLEVDFLLHGEEYFPGMQLHHFLRL